MEGQIKEESMEGFTNLLGNFKMDKFFGVSHNNSKDDLNLLNDLLDLHKLDKDNLLDSKDFIALDPLQHETFNYAANKELIEKAFKVELSLNSEPFIIFSRNNGIAKKQKKKIGSQSPIANRPVEVNDGIQYPETVENYLSLPLREDNNLDFTLQPPTMSTEVNNFESLGPNRNIISDMHNSNHDEYSKGQNIPEFSVQENVPFILGHPSQKGMLMEPDDNHTKISVEKKDNRDFSMHEISFNRDQFSNSMRTDQDTARSLQLAKHYELEEAEEEGNAVAKKRNVNELPLQIPHDKYRESKDVFQLSQKPVKEENLSPFMTKVPTEVIRRTESDKLKRESNEEYAKNTLHSENTDNQTANLENHLLNVFYQLINENKVLKQEMSDVHERLDEMSKHKEAETEIICNLQQNLELTMMLLKKRDEDFAKLQKKHDDLSKNFQNYIEQTSRPSHNEYYLDHPKSSNYLSGQELDEGADTPMDRSTRRSSSFTNAVHNSVRMSKPDLRKQMQQYEHQRSQKSFPTHFSEAHSVYDHDIAHNVSMEHRRNSSYSLRTSIPQNVDKRDSNYDTGNEYDSRYGHSADLHNQNQLQNHRVLQNIIKKSGFINQQVVQEREDMALNIKQQNVKSSKNENTGKTWHDKEQERVSMKENRYGHVAGNRPASVEPNNPNNAWTGGMAKQNIEKASDNRPKSKVQNYKKYSEMFKRQKEAFEQGNNFPKEDIKNKMQRK